jgi:hypothetical protein
VTTGALPAGLTLASTGSISGQATTAGTYPVTLTVTDSSSPHARASVAASLVVSLGAVPGLVITTSPVLPGAVPNQAYQTALQAAGGIPPLSWSVTSGTLPGTLQLAPNGVLSGAVPQAGTAQFTIGVSDSASPKQLTTQVFSLATGAPIAPGVPTAASATTVGAGAGAAVVTWTAPPNTASVPVQSYLVTVNPGGEQFNPGLATTFTVTGLSAGHSYTFTVSAINQFGTSAASAPSNAVVPASFPVGNVVRATTSPGGSATAATTDGNVVATASGAGSLVVGDYPDDPLAGLALGQTFVDVSIGSGSTFTSVSITVCGGTSPAGLQWWNPAAVAWIPVAGQTSQNGSCITLIVTANSSPSLADLTGTVFGLTDHPFPIPQPALAPPPNRTLAYGVSTALSADGHTALLGVPNDFDSPNQDGAVVVASDLSGAWTPVAVIYGPVNAGGSPGNVGGFGTSVALSGDGGTALVTAPNALAPGQSTPDGAAYIYSLSGGAWTEQAVLSAPDPNNRSVSNFGSGGVALSADGSTAIVGQSNWAAYVFSNHSGSWGLQASLHAGDQQNPSDTGTPPGDRFGADVSLSADGLTALVGAWAHAAATGAIDGATYVFSGAGGTWAQRAELVPVPEAAQGSDPRTPNLEGAIHVALSADASTAFVTEAGYETAPPRLGAALSFGAVAVYTTSNSWSSSTQTALLTPPDINTGLPDQFGVGLAAAAGGKTVLVADQGTTVWVFSQSRATWVARASLRNGANGFGSLCSTPQLDPYCADFAGPEPLSISSDGGVALVNSLVFGIGSRPGNAAPAALIPIHALTVVPGKPATIAVSAGTPQSAVVGTAFATPLAAKVTDASGNPVTGAAVTFTAPSSGASGTFANGTSIAAATTASDGVATASSFTANATVGGPYTVTATVTGAAEPADFALSNMAAPTQTQLGSSANPSVVGQPVTFTATIVATAGSGNPTGTVTFLLDGSAQAPLPLTGGQATLSVTTLNAGAHNIGASYSGDTTFASSAAPSLAQQVNSFGAPATIVVSAGTPQSALVGASFGVPLAAKVTDAFLNPVAGALVTFTAPASGPSGTFANGTPSTTSTSGPNGIATASSFIANATAGGPYTVTAAVTGAPGAADFTLTNSALISVAPLTLPSGVGALPYSTQLSASGGAAPYYFIVSAGSLPPGLVLSSSGLLSGTPSQPGAYSFTVRATDSAQTSGARDYSAVVTGGICIQLGDDITYRDCNPTTAGSVIVAPAGSGVPMQITGTVTTAGEHGGSAEVTFSLHHIIFLNLWLGTVTIEDPSANIDATVLAVGKSVSRLGPNGATGDFPFGLALGDEIRDVTLQFAVSSASS